MAKIKVAFYIAPGVFIDKAIRVWTKSKYSHCEIVLEGGLGQHSMCASSSAYDKGVRLKSIFLEEGHWEIVEVESTASIESIRFWIARNQGCKYDYAGTISFILMIISGRKTRWTCGEACADMLELADSWRFYPGLLYVVLQALKAKQ